MAININIPSQVKTYANLAAFPATGSLKTIFIAEDTNKTYRWTGSAYVEISASQATAWGAITGTLSNQTDLQTALNAKQDSLGFTAVPTTRTLTINGTTQDLSADRTFTISTGITIGTTAITSGTVGRVLFEGTGNVVQESANLFWDNTNGRLGIGGTPGAFSLDVNGTARVQGNTTISLNQNASTKINISNTTAGITSTAEYNLTSDATAGIFNFGKASSTYSPYKIFTASNGFIYNGTAGDIAILNDVASGRIKFSAGASTTAQMTLFSTGNVLINTTTDAGFKLDVNGTARVSGVTSVITASQRISFNLSNGVYIGQGVNNNAIGANNSNRLFIGSEGDMAIYTLNNGTLIISDIANPSSSASAKLRVDSTSQGFLPPRMTTTQKNAIATPATGLMVYDTTLNLISVYNGTTWITL